MRKTSAMVASVALALVCAISGATAFAAPEKPKPTAFEKFQSKEMADWRTFARGVKGADRQAKIKEYAEGMVKRYAAFRDTKEGKPFAFDVDKEALMISLALIRDDEQIRKYVASRQKADYGKRLEVHLARLYAQQRQIPKAQKIIAKVLEEAKDGDPELYAEAKRVDFQIDPVGKPFPEFPEGTKDTDGKPIRIADYKGKVVLVDFWAAWCGPCIQEAPNVVSAYKKYNPKGFEIIGISLDNTRKDMDAALKKLNMTWRQYYDGKGWKNEVSTEYGVGAIPAMYLVGPDGRVVSNNVRGPALHTTVERLLAKPPAGS